MSLGRKKVSPQTFLVCESTLLLHPELCFSTIKVESPKIPIGLKKKVQGFQGFQKGFQKKGVGDSNWIRTKKFRDSKDSRRDSKEKCSGLQLDLKKKVQGFQGF